MQVYIAKCIILNPKVLEKLEHALEVLKFDYGKV